MSLGYERQERGQKKAARLLSNFEEARRRALAATRFGRGRLADEALDHEWEKERCGEVR